MFGLSGSHLIILAVVVLLFGARRLPELGSALGQSIRSFKKGLEGLDVDERKEKQAHEKLPPSADTDSKA